MHLSCLLVGLVVLELLVVLVVVAEQAERTVGDAAGMQDGFVAW